MAENITAAYTLLKESLTQTTVFGIEWIVPTIALIILLTIITRDVNKWKILAFPSSIILHILGLKQSYIIMMILAIVMGVEAVSLQTIGNIIDVIRGKKEKEMVRKELEDMQKEHIRSRAKLGLTKVEDLLSKDISKAIARTRYGRAGSFAGTMGKIRPRGEEYELQREAKTELRKRDLLMGKLDEKTGKRKGGLLRKIAIAEARQGKRELADEILEKVARGKEIGEEEKQVLEMWGQSPFTKLKRYGRKVETFSNNIETPIKRVARGTSLRRYVPSKEALIEQAEYAETRKAAKGLSRILKRKALEITRKKEEEEIERAAKGLKRIKRRLFS